MAAIASPSVIATVSPEDLQITLEIGIRRWLNVPIRRFRRSDAGAALIEMALVTPVLILMALGAGDFGRLMYTGLVLTNAARAGAAYGSQSIATAMDTAGIQAAAVSDAQNIAPIVATASMVCTCTSSTPVTCGGTGATICGTYGVARVYTQVRTTKTFRTLIAWPGIPNTVPLSRTVRARVE